MNIMSFKEIRTKYPKDYLVLMDCESKELVTGELEITGAKHVQAYANAKEMYDAYRDLFKKGLNVFFATPPYQDSLIMEQRTSLRLRRSMGHS